LLSVIIESTVGFPMRITLTYILMAIFTSGGVGLVSGIYPAYKAARLSPIVALARE
jgi:putative ABC transport system permease protein